MQQYHPLGRPLSRRPKLPINSLLSWRSDGIQEFFGLGTRDHLSTNFVKIHAGNEQYGDRFPLRPDTSFPSPPALVRDPIDLSLFDNIPDYAPPASWTTEDILMYLPSGAAGLEGHSTDWIESLHSDSLKGLTLPLDEADKGRMPTFWQRARVSLKPKGPDAKPNDRRPITVLPVT